MLRLGADDRTVERFIETNRALDTEIGSPDEARGPAADRAAGSRGGSLHAKRVLGAGGSLSIALGMELRPGEIARAMRVEDLHGDVLDVFARIRRLSGLAAEGPEVVFRSS